jgi:hypothetical protein
MSVEADDYDLDDPRAALGPGAVVPDGTPERVHAVSREPARTSVPRLTMEVDLEGCTASFDAIGFPAIDLDAGVIAVPLAHVLQMSSAPGQLDLAWFDAESGDEIERDEVVSSAWMPADADETANACRRSMAPVRRALRAANLELGEHTWTTMEMLPLELYYDHGPDSDAAYRERRRPHERPVQVVTLYGDIVVRRLGVKVLERSDAPVFGDFFQRAYAHRESGTVLLTTRSCDGESCTCDPRGEAAVLHWKPETFAVIDAHPCVVDREAEVTCDDQPLPFEDNERPSWRL